MPPTYQARRDYAPQFDGGGAYRTGDSVADLIMRSGQQRAALLAEGGREKAALFEGIGSTLASGLQQFGAARDERKVQQAVLASRTPGAGGAPPDMNSILTNLPPELRARAMKGIADTDAAATSMEERRLKIAQAKSTLDAETRKAQQDVADYGATVAYHVKPFLDGEDGGLAALTVAIQRAQEHKVPGVERFMGPLGKAHEAMAQAQQSGDPAAMKAVADSVRGQFGPVLDQLGLSASAGLMTKLQGEEPKGVSLGEGSKLVDPRTGKVIAEGGPKEPNLQHVETADGIRLLNPKTGELGPVIAKGKPTGMGGMNSLYADVDPKALAEGIKRGDLPPTITDLGRPVGAAVSSELAKSGYNLAAAATDWKATQKHIATLNGAQQLRLNQAVNALPDLLDTVDSLASQWKGGRFPVLNKANLALAKGGAYGSDVASIANKLDAQIADVNADLAVVYMGGNSPTDHGLSLASKSLAGDWDEKVLHDMVKQAKGNVIIRRNSIQNTGVAGASAGNQYAPPAAPAAPPAGGSAEPTATGPNGQKLVLRNGQWVPVQ